MALIKCPDCGKKISDSVDACPNCGCKITEWQRENAVRIPQKTSTVLIISMIIGIIVCVIFVCSLFVIHGINTKKEEENQRIDSLYGEFNERVKDYINIVESYCIDYENLTDYEKSVWYNCIWKINDSKTDSFTKNKQGQFYNDFNKALENWHSSMDYSTFEQNIEYSIKREKSLFKKINGCELNKKDVKDKQKLVQSIHELLKDAIYFNEDGGYSYDEYDEKTNNYMKQVRRKINDLKDF